MREFQQSGWPRVAFYDWGSRWTDTVLNQAELDSIVRHANLLMIHRARGFSTNGRVNLLNLRARAAVADNDSFMIQGYEFWQHVRPNYLAFYPSGSPVWSALLDSIGARWIAKRPDGSSPIAWKGNPDTAATWYWCDLYEEDRPDWEYAAYDYVIAWADVIKKFNRLWQDVPFNGLFIDFPQAFLSNNYHIEGGCTGSNVCDVHFDDDGVVDYDGGGTGAWINQTARAGWNTTQRYMIRTIRHTLPHAFLTFNGTSGERGHNPDVWDPDTYGRFPILEVNAGSAFELMNYQHVQWLTTANYTYKERIDNAIIQGERAVLHSGSGTGLSALQIRRDVFKSNIIASLIVGCYVALQINELASGESSPADNIASITDLLFEAGEPLGPPIKMDLGGGVWRYVRQYENGWARIRFNANETAVLDSCVFDPNL